MTRSLKIAGDLILMLLLFFAPCFSSVGQDNHRVSASSAITSVLNAQESAWNKGDLRAFMDGYWNSPEVTFSGSSGVSRGWQSVYVGYQQRYPSQAAMGHLDFSNLEIRSLGPASALVLGKWHLTRTSSEVGGVFSLVFQELPEGWKIVHDHTSLVALQ